jgi:DNA primase catalytic core
VIPKDTIDQIIHTLQIEDVLADHIKLARKGSVFSALCPFHGEKTPSFIVSPSKNIYKCFGCGKSGDAIDFIREYKNLSFVEAVKTIAAKYQIPVPERQRTDEEIERDNKAEQIKTLYELAASFYQNQLFSLDLTPAKEALAYISTRLSSDAIKEWKIGFATAEWDAFSRFAISKGWSEQLLIESKLAKRSDRTNNLFDFFRERIIFPITDKAGRITSFAGRVLPGTDDTQVKYLNLPESDYYHKKELLYGLSKASREIKQRSNVFLVEGYTDVIRMHELGIINTVASAGTAFTIDQLKLLAPLTRKITILRDGDNAGTNAMLKDGKLIAANKLHPYLVTLPDGKDPADAWQSADEAETYIQKNTFDFISFVANDALEKAGADPMLKNDAVGEIASLLVNYDTTTRELYVSNISRQTKLKAKLINDKIKEIEASSKTFDDDNNDRYDNEVILPDGVDPAAYEKYGFFAYKNVYYFPSKNGHEKMSNFTMTPIFHINSINESKRIFELENCYGHKVVVDLDMQEMTSVQAFQRNIEGRGNFLFSGQINHLVRLKYMLYEQTKTCTEIRVLGWQKEGFWAWSNGIISGTNFIEVDEYGVVDHEGETYFIPAFSKIYINDKSIYTDERRFKFIQSSITLSDWSVMFMRVFGNNAMIGISFWVATLFRDLILRYFQNFPILNLFGPKGTGKSQMAVSLCYLFGEKQAPYNIHNGTKPGLAEHLQQFSNAFAWVDEYKNNIEYDKIETLKSIYDAIGRSRLNMDKGRKKETTNVNSGVILSGQEMPTADVALFSRVIFLMFNQTEFTDAEKHQYDLLKKTEAKGLSHITSNIIKHRKHFEENFYDVYQETLTDFNEHFAENPVEDRIMRSMVSIVAAWRTISQVVSFPFTYNELLDVATKSVEYQNAQISRSNEIGMFWNLLESLFDENLIQDKFHFRIDYDDQITTKHTTISLPQPEHVLKFKYNTIYSLYAQLARKQGIKPLPSDTLQYYLKNHKAFIGIQNQCVFTEKKYNPAKQIEEERTQNTSAMCFKYEILGINLERSDAASPHTTPTHSPYPPHPTDNLNPKFNTPPEIPW